MTSPSITSGANRTQPSVFIDRYCAVLAIFLGIVVLAGWAAGNESAKRLLPGFVAMNPATACAFFACGLALLLSVSTSNRVRSLSRVVSGAVIFVGVSRLVAYCSSYDLALDQYLFRSQLSSATDLVPNRMAPHTAFGLALLGASLFFLADGKSRATWKTHFSALTAALLAVLAIVGYSYQVPQLYSIATFIPIALHTALGIIIVCVGILAAKRSGGLRDIQTKLLFKMYAGYLALIFIIMSVIGVLLDLRVQKTYLENARDRLQNISTILASSAATRPAGEWTALDLAGLNRSIGDEFLGLSLLDSSQQLISTSRSAPETMDPSTAPLRAEGAVRSNNKEPVLSASAPILQDSETVGYVKAELPLFAVRRRMASFRQALLSGTVAALLLALGFGYFFAHRITAPLAEMTRSAEALAEGDLTFSARISGSDEIAILGRSLRTMAERLSRHVSELEQSRQDADAANRAKSRFLANVSHEVRTPLAAIVGMTGLLSRTELTEKQRRFVEIAQAAGSDLGTLINNILDLSKAEAGRMELEVAEFDLQITVEDVVELLSPKAMAKGLDLLLHIDRDVPTLLRGDGPRLKQVLVNLIANAVKFTDQGEVMVRVSLAEDSGEQASIRFEVRDTGIGIPEDATTKLFQPFAQAESSTARTYGGTGLGLSICKQLVSLMKGDIGLERDLARGCAFWFTIPFVKQQVAQPPVDGSQLKGLRILIVDRNVKYRTLLEEHISGWGMQVDGVTSDDEGAQSIALKIKARQPYHVVLVEMTSEKVSQPLLLDRIKPQSNLERPLFIALVSLNDDLDSGVLRKMGFVTSLTKPVRQSTLLDTIMNVTFTSWSLQQPVLPRIFADSPPPSSATGKGRILLAEDNIANQLVAGEVISSLGFEYDIASDGKQACEAAATFAYDLILMDCQMPVMDGLQAARVIRESERVRSGGEAQKRRVPIVALTANAVLGDRERCFDAGMDEYCSKPINVDQLALVVKRFLAARTLGTNAAEKAEFAQDSYLDVNVFVGRCMGNYATALKALKEFESQLRRDGAEIQRLLRDQNFEGVEGIAHSLKGVSATVEASRLAQICSNVQRAARDRDLVTLRESANALLQEATLCFEGIRNVRSILEGKIRGSSPNRHQV